MSRCAAEYPYLNWKEWSLVLLAALAVHLILFILCRPLLESETSLKQDTPFTVLLPDDYLDSNKDPYHLKYWLKYADPRQLIHPDMKHGFSMVLLQNKKNVPDIQNFRHDLFPPVAQYRLHQPQIPQARDMADLLEPSLSPLVRHSSSETPSTISEVKYPLWTDNSGKVFSGLFIPDKESLNLIRKSEPDQQTVLRMSLIPDKIPDIELIRSCGVPALDQLAKRQLLSQKMLYRSKNKMERYFYIHWHAPKHSLSGRNTK